MDSQNLTYYQVLQVDRNADRAVIDASYRRLARIYHPDYNDSAEALSMMQQLNVAYSTLRDPNERSAYDTQLALLNEHAARFTKSTDLFATNSWLAVPSLVAVFLFIFVLFFNPSTRIGSYSNSISATATSIALWTDLAVKMTVVAMPVSQGGMELASTDSRRTTGSSGLLEQGVAIRSEDLSSPTRSEPTVTLFPIHTATLTKTPVPTVTPSPTLDEQSAIALAIVNSTSTETPVPALVNTSAPTETATTPPTSTSSATETAMNTATSTATQIPTETATTPPTSTNSATETAVNTATSTATQIPTETATALPTSTSSATATNTATPFGPPTSTSTSTGALTGSNASKIDGAGTNFVADAFISSALVDTDLYTQPNSESVAGLFAETVVYIVSRTEDSKWYQLDDGYWVKAEAIDKKNSLGNNNGLENPTPINLPATGVAKEDTNLFDTSASSRQAVAGLYADTLVMITAISEDGIWYQLDDGYWVAGDLIDVP